MVGCFSDEWLLLTKKAPNCHSFHTVPWYSRPLCYETIHSRIVQPVFRWFCLTPSLMLCLIGISTAAFAQIPFSHQNYSGKHCIQSLSHYGEPCSERVQKFWRYLQGFADAMAECSAKMIYSCFLASFATCGIAQQHSQGMPGLCDSLL